LIAARSGREAGNLHGHSTVEPGQSEASIIMDDDSAVLAVLSLLSDSSNHGKILKPQLEAGYGLDGGSIVYDLGDGFALSYEKLSRCEKKGLVSVAGHVAFSSCPKCDDLALQTQFLCPECSSQDLLKSDLLIHYECQTSGPVEEFQSNLRNGYFCNKCRKELKRVGIDYGNPGIGFKCAECEKVFQFPSVMSSCSSGHVSKIDEMNLKSFPKYAMGQNAKGLSTLLIQSRKLRDELAVRNIGSQVLATIKGASGVSHVVPLLIKFTDHSETVLTPASSYSTPENIAIEFIDDDDAEFDKMLLQLLIKSADLENTRMIIVQRGSPNSVQQIKSIVNPKKVKVLSSGAECNGDSLPEEILREVTNW
jgi:hypothetical protein